MQHELCLYFMTVSEWFCGEYDVIMILGYEGIRQAHYQTERGHLL